MSAVAPTGRTLAMGENETRSAGSDIVEAPFGSWAPCGQTSWD
jgi:hypothetical protein